MISAEKCSSLSKSASLLLVLCTLTLVQDGLAIDLSRLYGHHNKRELLGNGEFLIEVEYVIAGGVFYGKIKHALY